MTSEGIDQGIDQSGDRGQDETRARGELRCSDRDPWALYDEMIAGIPEGVAVTDFCVGRSWCYVVADCGMGIGHTVAGGARRRFQGDPRDLDLRALASLAKSWNFVDASLGVAALNAWYCRPEAIRALGGTIDEGVVASHDASNPLRGMLCQRWQGKRVAVVGHFPGVEAMARQAQVTVLERDCSQDGDVPDSACEFVVPRQDFVLMTGTTLTNKTAPRLLELARDAVAVMVGPSSVPSPALIAHGADVIGGSVVVDPEPARFAIKGGSKQDWRAGIRKFSIERP
ncbi:MAG: DUF364 domain-containing protein [Coriobacteriales bacterium]|jgi:uncharacterized protein (DUF4213/DUF364 family)